MNAILELLIFIFSLFVCFYLPSKVITKALGLKFNLLEDVFFNITFGLVIFTLVSYVLNWLKIDWLVLPIFILLGIGAFKIKGIRLKIPREHIYPSVLISILSFIFSLTVITSGQFGQTFRLVGANQGDALWHISLINELKNNFPPGNPGFSQVPLVGYHFFFNFLLAQISKIFNLPVSSLYFHFFPLLFSFLWSFGAYVLMFRWSNKISLSILAVFMSLFGGSFSFFLLILGHKGFSMDDAFGMTQPASSLVNPPFAISIILLIAFLYSVYRYFKEMKNGWLIPIALIAGAATLFKVYAGIIILGSLLIISGWEIIKKRYVFIPVILSSFGIFLATYWIFRDPTSRLFFDPLWSPHRVLESMTWYGFDEKYSTYSRLGVISGLVKVELFGLFIFIVGSLGTRAIGLLFLVINSIHKFKFPSKFALVVLFMSIVSLIVPLFFIQSGKVFEIIQLTWYFLFLSSLSASFGIYYLFKILKYKLLFLLIFLIFTLPSAYEKLIFYAGNKAEYIPKDYIAASEFLKNQGSYNSTVLEMPPPYVGYTKEGMNWWFNFLSNTKLLAFSNKRGYLNNEGIVFRGTDWNLRIPLIIAIVKFEKLPDDKYISYRSEIETGLRDNKIVYIFSEGPLLRLEKTNIIQRIFQNKTASIYKVNL